MAVINHAFNNLSLSNAKTLELGPGWILCETMVDAFWFGCGQFPGATLSPTLDFTLILLHPDHCDAILGVPNLLVITLTLAVNNQDVELLFASRAELSTRPSRLNLT